MAITKTRTFRSGNSQAVRLPKEVAYADDVELVVVRSGDVITLYPATLSMADMVERLAKMPAPPSIELRDTVEIPERNDIRRD